MTRPRGIRVSAGSRHLVIPAEALDWQFARSSGPGGQHVNRTSSKAILRFDVAACPGLPEDVRQRFLERERSRLTQDGAILIASQRHREQPRNVADCLAKLSAILERALTPPKSRRRTKTPRSAIRERLAAKKRRSETKQRRAGPVE
jgi:ribosome-associated protein